MRRLFRLVLWLASALVIIGGVAAAFNWERLVRLNNVNTLFDEGRIVSNFSSMKDLFFWKEVKRSGDVVPWVADPASLPATYTFDGAERQVSAFLEKTATTSLVVIRDGKLVHEEYRLGTKPEDRRISWSMAKSFLSAMFGAEVVNGNISLADPVDKYAPALKGTVYEGVTVRNVLNMASGVKFNEDYLDFWSDINKMGRVLALEGSMDEFAAGLEAREREQGQLRQYTSIDTHVLGMVLRGVTGKDLPQLMEERLWSKLGVETDAYYLTDGFGVAFALAGINATTRDYAKFGQMMLDLGRYNGQQIVPLAWAIDAVKATAPKASDPLDPFGYGYQWWVPLNPDDEFYAIGIYGQFIYVNRPARIVVVKTSADRNFRNDNANGSKIEEETLQMFRGIASGLTNWKQSGPN